ncbi:hypothetical protein LguiB_016112 [Lonicera macranthoides]
MKGPLCDSRKVRGPPYYQTMTGKEVNEKENLRSEVSIFRNRERRFISEFKSFRFEIDNGGDFVKIVEKARNQTFTLSMDFGGAFWLITSLKKAKAQRRMQNLSIELDEFEQCVIEIDVANVGNKGLGPGVAGIAESKPGLHVFNRMTKLGNQDLLKKGEIKRDNGSVHLFSNKSIGRRITVLRGDEVVSDNSDEEEGEELDVDREPEGKVHEEDELCQTEGIEVLAEQNEDFQIHDEGKLQADDEFFDKMVQQERMEDVENIKESDFEEYRTEENKRVEEDSDVGIGNLFKDSNLASTEHVSYNPMSERQH